VEVEATGNLRQEASLYACEYPAEAQELKNPLRIRKGEAQEESAFIRVAKLKIVELVEENRQRPRPLRKLKILPSPGRRCESSGGSNNSRQISWGIDLDRWFSRPGSSWRSA
jgi:hypothetical protein